MGEENMIVDSRIAGKFEKLFNEKAFLTIDAPPYFHGSGFTEDKRGEIKSEVLQILIENIKPAEKQADSTSGR